MLYWKEKWLSYWFCHHSRPLSDTEARCFSLLLSEPRDRIDALLNTLIEQARRNSYATPKPTLNLTCDHEPHNQLAIQVQASNGTSFPGHDMSGRYSSSDYTRHDPTTRTSLDLHHEPSNDVGYPESSYQGKGRQPIDQINQPSIRSNSNNGKDTARSFVPLHSDASNTPLQYGPSAHTTLNVQKTVMLRPTEALRQLARSIILNSVQTGCKSNGHRTNQSGPYACTLGCGYRSKRHKDLIRHEQIVYPQQFWFCFMCGDPAKPTAKHVYTRDDKIHHHIKTFHRGVLAAKQCEVTGVRSLFPEQCAICLHHPQSWDERCKHVRWHHESGHVFPPPIPRQSNGEGSQHPFREGDSDSDDEDNDDDSGDHQSEEESDEAHGPDGDPSFDSPHGDQDQDNYASQDTSGDFSELFDFSGWASSGTWGFAQRRHVNRVLGTLQGRHSLVGSSAVQKRVGRVYHSGATTRLRRRVKVLRGQWRKERPTTTMVAEHIECLDAIDPMNPIGPDCHDHPTSSKELEARAPQQAKGTVPCPPGSLQDMTKTRICGTNPKNTESQNSEPYQYQPLDSIRQQIRLLRPRPAALGTSELQFDLHTVDLDSAPKYTALSYCWGDSGLSDYITIDDKILRVRGSSHDAIQAAHRKTFEWLWVDSVCINQHNIQERNEQVSSMARIYRQAAQVIVWLGPDDDRMDETKSLRDLVARNVIWAGTLSTERRHCVEIFQIIKMRHDTSAERTSTTGLGEGMRMSITSGSRRKSVDPALAMSMDRWLATRDDAMTHWPPSRGVATFNRTGTVVKMQSGFDGLANALADFQVTQMVSSLVAC